MRDASDIIKAIEEGQAKATDELLPLVYDELRRLAARRLSAEDSTQSLQATALVHEAYLRLVAERAQVIRQRDTAVAEQQRADANYRSALEALNKAVVGVLEAELPERVELTAQDRERLRSLLPFYQVIVKNNPSTPQAKQDIAMAYLRIGRISESLGSVEEADLRYATALNLLEELVSQHPLVQDYQLSLCKAYLCRGELLCSVMNKNDAARGILLKGVAQLEALRAQKPDASGYQERLGWVYCSLGICEARLGLTNAAEATYARAIELGEGLAKAHPENPKLRQIAPLADSGLPVS